MLWVACGSEKPKETEKAKPEAPAEFKVRFETTKGDFEVTVRKEWAPIAAGRFYELVAERFFDDTKFYRVLRGQFAQFGFHRDPKKSQLWSQNRMLDDRPKLKNTKGTLAFAQNGPNSRTTQIFINLKDHPELDGQGFVPFAKITAGDDVPGKLYAGYGETSNRGGAGPDPQRIEALGTEYLNRSYERLDGIKRVVGPL
jgi:peptidyl-prolyl cis-trans isomerase A (cyclophilin A)